MEPNLSLIERLAAVFEKWGVKPAVSLTFLAGLVLVVVNWAIYGEPFDLDTARGLVGVFVLAVAGVVAPPAVGTTLNKISRYRDG